MMRMKSRWSLELVSVCVGGVLARSLGFIERF